VLVEGRVDGRTLEIKPESLAVPSQPRERDLVVPVDLQRQFVALVAGVVLAQPLVEETHQAPRFGRFGINFYRPAQMPFGILELPAAQCLPGEDQVGAIAPGKCPSEEAISDGICAASG
jgi:hypothetical protein